MFLPELSSDSDAAIEFDDVDLISASTATTAPRVAILSQAGVNLLVQRWVHHMSRMVVPTLRLNEMIAGQFDEADLIGEVVQELVENGADGVSALEQVDAWLDTKDDGRLTRRAMLYDPQKRSTVRSQLRRAFRSPQ